MNQSHIHTESGIWIAATTHPHKEATAIANLLRQGYQAYCPMIRRRRRHARQVHEVLRPLFPGYVFIGLESECTRWRPIASTIGVRNLVRFGDRLGMLPPRFVEAIRAKERDGAVPLGQPDVCYAPGDRVRICDGPFEGLIATVLSVEEHSRLQILMQLLSRAVRVHAPLEAVAPA